MFFVRANFNCVKGHLMLHVNCHQFFPKSSAFPLKILRQDCWDVISTFSEGKPNFNFLDKNFLLSPKIFATYNPKFLMTFLVNYFKQGRLEGAQVEGLPRSPFLSQGPGRSPELCEN